MKDYEKIIRIGRGGFGKVWAAYDKKNNRKVAIKIIDLNEYISFVESREEKKFTPKQKQRYLNDINEMIPKEVTNMILMKCEYSVKFIDLIKEDNIYNMIMELCDSDLFHIIKDNKGLTIKQIYQILLQLNIAFKEMVRNNIIHRDIKPHNILIKYTDQSETRFNVKLSDYGISKIMTSNFCKHNVGSYYYSSPQVINEKPYTNKCDLYSIGATIYHMYFNKVPEGNSFNIKTEDENFNSLLNGLLEYYEEDRIGWDEYFEHKFFKHEPKNVTENYEDEVDEDINEDNNEEDNDDVIIKGIRSYDYEEGRSLFGDKNKIYIKSKNNNNNDDDSYNNRDEEEEENNDDDNNYDYYIEEGIYRDKKEFSTKDAVFSTSVQNNFSTINNREYTETEDNNNDLNDFTANKNSNNYYNDNNGNESDDEKNDENEEEEENEIINNKNLIKSSKNVGGQKFNLYNIESDNDEEIKNNDESQSYKNGIIYYNNADKYKGEYKIKEKKLNYSMKDTSLKIKEGYGIMEYKNGNKYEGEWKNDKKNGRGKMEYFFGDVYEGNWVDNKKEGKGKYIFGKGKYDGDIYEGEFKCNKAHGFGIYYFNHGNTKGDRFEGFWENDKKEGKGKYFYKDGDIYEGIWKNGKKSGKMNFYNHKTKKWVVETY